MRRAARAVYIAGQGQVPVTRLQGATLAEMGASSIHSAIEDAGLVLHHLKVCDSATNSRLAYPPTSTEWSGIDRLHSLWAT